MLRLLMILLLALSSSLALADESEVPKTESPSQAVRAEFLVELGKQLTSSHDAEKVVMAKCQAAKESYREAESELARIATELEAPAGESIGDMRTSYVTTLQRLQKEQEGKLAKAKSEAQVAGEENLALKVKIKDINAEIDRIKKEIRLEKERVRRDSLVDGLPAYRLSGAADVHTSTRIHSMGADGLGGTFGRTSKPKPPPPLPVEFKDCFPKEVVSGS